MKTCVWSVRQAFYQAPANSADYCQSGLKSHPWCLWAIWRHKSGVYRENNKIWLSSSLRQDKSSSDQIKVGAHNHDPRLPNEQIMRFRSKLHRSSKCRFPRYRKFYANDGAGILQRDTALLYWAFLFPKASSRKRIGNHMAGILGFFYSKIKYF